jgi:hypothetical protein
MEQIVMGYRSGSILRIPKFPGWIMPLFFFSMPLVATAAPPAAGSTAVPPPDAHAILMRMAEFLSKASRMSVTINTAYDTVQPNGHKVEWNDIRKITLSRPNRLRIETQRSDGAHSLILFDSKNITTFDESRQVYARAPQPGGVDESLIRFVRDMHMRMPLALLLLSRLPQELQSRVQRVAYVEKTTTLGAPAHHLAGQTGTVDFQIWIADGDEPLPLRAVLTYKNAPGQPQFRAQFSDWDLAAIPPDSMFAFTPPAQAKRIPFASELPQTAALGSRGTPAKKGAKR